MSFTFKQVKTVTNYTLWYALCQRLHLTTCVCTCTLASNKKRPSSLHPKQDFFYFLRAVQADFCGL